jgi:3-hydroxy-9,10-secoandrosta-1,3,5(10)-triene-9,17-dione monooxygenase reductase component
MSELNPQSFREFFGQLPTGVTVVVARGSTGPVGMVVGTFSSVSLTPPLVSFMVTSGSRAWRAVREAGAFTANILASDQRGLSQTLAGWSPGKFRDVAFAEEQTLSITGCLAWAECEIDREVEAGDHVIVLATPLKLTIARRSAQPLVYYQRGYHRTMSVEEARAPGWV